MEHINNERIFFVLSAEIKLNNNTNNRIDTLHCLVKSLDFTRGIYDTSLFITLFHETRPLSSICRHSSPAIALEFRQRIREQIVRATSTESCKRFYFSFSSKLYYCYKRLSTLSLYEFTNRSRLQFLFRETYYGFTTFNNNKKKKREHFHGKQSFDGRLDAVTVSITNTQRSRLGLLRGRAKSRGDKV